jgi:hypothetical protein
MLQSGLNCFGCGTSCSFSAAATGTLSDGSGSENYVNMAFCNWLIAPTGATNVSITFTVFDTEETYDAVRVYWCSDTSCASTGLVTSLSGSITNSPSFTTKTGVLLVQFTSDNMITGAGFAVSWQTIIPGKEVWPFLCFVLSFVLLAFAKNLCFNERERVMFIMHLKLQHAGHSITDGVFG